MAAWEQNRAELEELGATIYAVSVDDSEKAQEMADATGMTFPVAYGATREDADKIGAWWDDNRGGYIQPAEFIMGRGGVVLGSVYASGPVGRMGADEAMRLITSREQRRREQEQAEATAAR